MPVFRVSIQKSAEGRYWTNRYHVQAPDLTEAQEIGELIVSAEKSAHLSYVSFVSMLSSTIIPGDDSYIVTPLTGLGLRTSYTSAVPLTVCARIVMQAGPGRPDAKFLRASAGNMDIQTPIVLKAAYVSEMNAGYCASLLAIGTLVTEAGVTYETIATSPKVSNHQLSRGTRKQVTPVIPLS